MNKLMIAGVAGAFLAGGAAMADEPMKLTDGQMDDVTAGWRLAGAFGFTGGGFAGAVGSGGGGVSEYSQTETIDTGGFGFTPGTGGGLVLFSTLGAASESTISTGFAGTAGGASGSFGTFGTAFVASD